MKKILLIHDVCSSINDIFIKDFMGNLRKYLIIAPELHESHLRLHPVLIG